MGGEIASNVDWSTDKSVVNPVKDQGQCGSCWAFSAVGTVESAYALAAGKLGSYAEQQLVDCDTTGGSEGCNGGFNQYGISSLAPPALPPRAATHTRPLTAPARPALSPRHWPRAPSPVTRASARTTLPFSRQSPLALCPSPLTLTTRGSCTGPEFSPSRAVSSVRLTMP